MGGLIRIFFWIRIEIRISDYDPDWNPDFRLRSGLKQDFGFPIRIKTGFQILNRGLIQFSDFRSGLKPDSRFQIRIKTGFRILNPDLIQFSDFRSGLKPDYRFQIRIKTGFRIKIRFWFKANLNLFLTA